MLDCPGLEGKEYLLDRTQPYSEKTEKEAFEHLDRDSESWVM